MQKTDIPVIMNLESTSNESKLIADAAAMALKISTIAFASDSSEGNGAVSNSTIDSSAQKEVSNASTILPNLTDDSLIQADKNNKSCIKTDNADDCLKLNEENTDSTTESNSDTNTDETSSNIFIPKNDQNQKSDFVNVVPVTSDIAERHIYENKHIIMGVDKGTFTQTYSPSQKKAQKILNSKQSEKNNIGSEIKTNTAEPKIPLIIIEDTIEGRVKKNANEIIIGDDTNKQSNTEEKDNINKKLDSSEKINADINKKSDLAGKITETGEKSTKPANKPVTESITKIDSSKTQTSKIKSDNSITQQNTTRTDKRNTKTKLPSDLKNTTVGNKEVETPLKNNANVVNKDVTVYTQQINKKAESDLKSVIREIESSQKNQTRINLTIHPDKCQITLKIQSINAQVLNSIKNRLINQIVPKFHGSSIEPATAKLLFANTNSSIINKLVNKYQLSIVKEMTRDNCAVTLSGTKTNLGDALKQIQALSSEKTMQNFSEYHKFKREMLPLLRGPFDSKLKSYIQMFNGDVRIECVANNSDETSNVVRVYGHDDHIKKLFMEFDKLLDSFASFTSASIPLEKKMHAKLLTSFGIDKLLSDTGTAVTIPPLKSASSNISFFGKSSDLADAIRLTIGRATNYKLVDISCEKWVYSKLQSEDDFCFANLKAKYLGLWLSYFEAKASITLDGPSEIVTILKEQFNNKIKEISGNNICHTVKMPYVYRDSFFGANKALFERIQLITCTEITLSAKMIPIVEPSQIEKNMHIRHHFEAFVVGDAFAAEEASNILLELLDRMNRPNFNSENTFDFYYYGYILDQLAPISLFDDLVERFGPALRVNIKKNKPQNIVTVSLTGPQGMVESADYYLDSLLSVVKKTHLIQRMKVPAAYHYLLIGKQGSIKQEIEKNSGLDKLIISSSGKNKSTNVGSENQYGSTTSTKSSTNESSVDVSSEDEVVLIGNQQAIQTAIEMIEKRISIGVVLSKDEIFVSKSVVEFLGFGRSAVLRKLINLLGATDKSSEQDSKKSDQSTHDSLDQQSNQMDDSDSVGVQKNTLNPLNLNVHLPNPPLSESNNSIKIHGEKSLVEKFKELVKTLQTKKGLSFLYIDVPASYHKTLIGRNYSNINKLLHGTGVDIIFPNPGTSKTASNIDISELDSKRTKGSNADKVLIYCNKPEELNKVKSQIVQFATEMKNTIEMQVPIPHNYINKFHVRTKFSLEKLSNNVKSSNRPVEKNKSGGEYVFLSLVQRIVADYPTLRISFPSLNTPENESSNCFLKGPSQLVKAAAKEISAYVDRWSRVTSQVLTISFNESSILYRRTGAENLYSICDKFNVEMKVIKRKNDQVISTSTADQKDGEAEQIAQPADTNVLDKDVSYDIILNGLPEDLEKVKKEYTRILPKTVELAVDKSLHSSLIGSKGANIKEFTKKYNVSFQFPQQNVDSDVVLVIGAESVIDKAIDELNAEIKKLTLKKEEWSRDNSILEMDLNPKYFPRLIGRDGKTINGIKRQFGININIPSHGKRPNAEEAVPETTPSASDKLVLKGRIEQCEKARDRILKMVDEWDNTVTKSLNIPHALYPTLKGERNANLNTLTKQFKVTIRFPLPREESDEVKVTGLSPDVEAASEHIFKLVESERERIALIEMYEAPDEMLGSHSIAATYTNRSYKPHVERPSTGNNRGGNYKKRSLKDADTAGAQSSSLVFNEEEFPTSSGA